MGGFPGNPVQDVLLCVMGFFIALGPIPRRPIAKIVAIVLISFCFLGDFYLYRTTTRHFLEYSECRLSAYFGEYCKGDEPNIADGKASPAPRSDLASAAATQPRIAQPLAVTLDRPASPVIASPRDGPHDGWYEIGQPLTPTAAQATEQAAWNWVQDRPHACQPLRNYQEKFSEGPHAREVSARLDGRSEQSITSTHYEAYTVSYADFPSEAANPTQAAKACASASSGTDLSVSMACGFVATGRGLLGKNSDNISYYLRKVPSSCVCAKKPYAAGYTCNVKIQNTCLFKNSAPLDIETCP